MGVLLSAAGFLPLADTWGMHDVGAGWGVVMLLLMILFWAAVVFGVIWLMRGGPLRGESTDTPTEILKRRLADGTLTAEEYEARRRLLSEDVQPAPRQGSAEAGGPAKGP